MLTTDLSPHLALVTGATGGIGKATCIALAALGCSIAVHYNSAADDAGELVKQLEAKGVRAKSFQADLGKYDDVRRLHSAVTSALGPPTILFNNAGSSLGKSGIKSITDITIDDFENTWRTNCGTAFLLTQLCMPAMEAKGWGRVIFCSSVAGFTGGVVGPHYAYATIVRGRRLKAARWLTLFDVRRSSKSALHGLIHWLAGAYANKGITVNGVAPALIGETKMLPGTDQELSNRIPLGRYGSPDEIAETVVWMVKTGYVTNKVIGVDGGWFPQ